MATLGIVCQTQMSARAETHRSAEGVRVHNCPRWVSANMKCRLVSWTRRPTLSRLAGHARSSGATRRSRPGRPRHFSFGSERAWTGCVACVLGAMGLSLSESLSGNLCVRHNRREGAYYAEQSEEN